MIIYPDKPWYDGQEFEHTTSEGQKLTGTYDLKHETWVFRDYRLPTDLVYTDTVYTVNMRPSQDSIDNAGQRFDPNAPLPSPDIFTTQQDVNWYLYDLIKTTGGNLWIGVLPPPEDNNGVPILGFWWNPDEELLYYWDASKEEWVLTGLMEFDRPPIVQATPPVRHPKFPEDPLEIGDFWIDSANQIFYWNGTEWTPTYHDDDRPPIISADEPTEHPKFPGEPLQEGDFWIDNHQGRAFTTLYYWTGTKWEEIEDHEDWDEQIKKHTCAQFYKSVYEYNAVGAKEGHFCTWRDFNNGTEVKYWTGPSGKDFYHNGDKIYINDQGPYDIYNVVDETKWTTFFIKNGPKFNIQQSVVVKFSKIPKLCDTSLNDGRYVLKAGDTMTGDLLMKDASIDFVRTGESLKDGNGDPILDANGDEQWDTNNDRFGHIESLPPQLIRSDGTSGGDTSEPFGIRVEIDDGNTWKNQFTVGNRHGDAVTIQGGTGPNIVLGDFARRDGAQHGIDNGVLIKNIPTPDRELTPGDFAVNKEYVDKEDLALLNGLIDLQEEIDAIAPSLEKGAWEWDPNLNVSRPPDPGKYYLLRGVFPTWTITDDYTLADAVVFHIRDMSGANHENWDTIPAGKLILLFDKPDPDRCLGKIHNIYDIGESNNPFGTAAIVEFNRIEANGKPNNNTDDDGKYVTYVNIFEEPSGGDASEFVLKKGDKMTGNLEMINSEFIANDYDPNNNTAHLEFSTKSPSTQTDRTVRWWQPGYVYVTITDGTVVSERDIVSSRSFRGGSRSGSSFAYYAPEMKLESSKGSLRWSSDQILNWNNNQIGAYKPIYINDDAKATVDDHAIHKGYVDDKYEELLAKIEELEMAGGGGTNYRLQLRTVNTSGFNNIGSTIAPGQIMTVRQLSTNYDGWGLDTNSNPSTLGGENGYAYVSFDDDTWAMNSTGTLHSAEVGNSNNTFKRESEVYTHVISKAEKCPDAYSAGQNIWRFEIIPNVHKPNSTNYLGSFSTNAQILVTFAGGSLTKS